MNRQAALSALMDNHKITHIHFSPNEYLYMLEGDIYTEDRYLFTDRFFDDPAFETGWSIYEA